MRMSEVQKAVDAAHRFLAAADKLRATVYNGKVSDNVDYGKDSGAARRASLDLTRQLSAMRKP